MADRKSTRLNSSHRCISYAVFCLKKKNSRVRHPHAEQDLPDRHLELLAGQLPRDAGHPFFFFNDTATTEIYTLSLHDALPICYAPPTPAGQYDFAPGEEMQHDTSPHELELDGRKRKVQTASAVLCYSRML